MTTAARPVTEGSSHWYLNGAPFYEVPYADPSKGMRKATLADARKVGAVPSVTNVLSLLNKPALNTWMAEQAVLAVMTTPQKPGETIDGFIHRVLHEDRVQDEQAAKARQLGTEIHDAIDESLRGNKCPVDLWDFIAPAMRWVRDTGRVVWSEKILTGDGYAGRADCLLDNELLNALVLVDFKTTSSLPKKESWTEHRLQTAAYAACLGNTNGRRVLTANVYISTTEPGKIAVFTQDDWIETFVHGFRPLLSHWQWANGYYPTGRGHS